MRTIRIAIIGPSPCHRCYAACCKQNGHEFAAILRGAEVRRFAAFSVAVSIRRGDAIAVERVLPYIEGRCQFLGDDDRCTIYDDRPAACRSFECVDHFNCGGVGRHGEFLARNPSVLALLNK